MQKDFDVWNNLKKDIEVSSRRIVFREREIWWCQLGLNIGDEEDGKNEAFERPVLILRKFNKHIAVVLPLTTKGKMLPFYHQILSDSSYVILSQVRLVSSKRFLRRTKRLGRREFGIIQQKLVTLLV